MKTAFHYLWATLFLILGIIPLQGQLSTQKDSLEFWGDVMLNGLHPKNRLIASAEFDQLFNQVLTTENDLQLNLKGNYCKVSPTDKAFILYTWQVMDEGDLPRYYGYVITPQKQIKKLHFKDRDIMKMRFESQFPSSWFGSLYFHVLPVEVSPGVYTLLSFRQGLPGIKYKIIETLTFEKDVPIFGVDVFSTLDDKHKKQNQKRIIIPYSASASCSIKYNELDKQLVYDHILQTFDPRNPESLLFLPDGSYEAFEIKNQQWTYIEKLEVTPMNEPPRPVPVLDQHDKDLFGKPKK